ncbi:hypothetical protein Tsubulata_049487 [Turnera subulata]|uniref:Protein kinase domain-containing protein n=1 Tax=Turnera subulata TaxID=218843 RepID=A0A9Q0IZW6_9ROSI|nr:hypothetical protein Tsubulata_049487 [Turnera subulata]
MRCEKMMTDKIFSCFKLQKEHHQVNPEFMENGTKLLKEMVATYDGRCNIPIRTFSSRELQQATNNYDPNRIISDGVDFTIYQGFLEEHRPVSIKKCRFIAESLEYIGSPFTDIAVGAQMSVHQNVLKLIGCCLESEHPILVHEFAGNHNLLNDYVNGNNPSCQLPSWKYRIKIALDIANAVAYLHNSVLSRPVIHRDLTLRNIVIVVDQSSYLAKLTNFSSSLSIPDGETHLKVDRIIATHDFVAPEFVRDGYLSEKTDVYSYGGLLFCILTGWHPLKFFLGNDGRHSPSHLWHRLALDIVDPALLQEGIEEGKLRDFGTLAQKCISAVAENRPTMIEERIKPSTQFMENKKC